MFEGDIVLQDGESIPDSDGCNTCTCVNGTIVCTQMACPSCWGASDDASGGCVGPNGGSYPDECCDESVLCDSTGGRWDEDAACGHYYCGEQLACFAPGGPGCDCGPDRNFVAGYGCLFSNECSPGCLSPAGGVIAEGESFQDADGCNVCVCDNGFILCTARACAP